MFKTNIICLNVNEIDIPVILLLSFMPTPLEYYLSQKAQFEFRLGKVVSDLQRIAIFRLLVAITGIIFFILALRGSGAWTWWAGGTCLAGFLVLVRFFHRFSDRRDVLQLHLEIITGELKAVEGDYSKFADGGAYIDIGHSFSFDLDLFGKGSVYQMLCRCVTLEGGKLLAGKLSAQAESREKIKVAQEIIQDLSTQPGFLQDFRVAGTVVEESNRDFHRLTEWINGEDHFSNSKVVRVASVVMPMLSLILLITSGLAGELSRWLLPVILMNWTLLSVYKKYIIGAILQVGHSAGFIDKYEGLVQQTAATEFQSNWLKNTGQAAVNSLKSIKSFKKSVHLFDIRENGLVGPIVNTLFLFDFFCLLRLERWRKKNRQGLLDMLGAMVIMDVYTSCAVYAFNNPEYIYPDINGEREILAKDLHNPLLSKKSSVGNDFTLGQKEQFYLLTGANMTGKSTFIRTLGICNVLSVMGLPLPAKSASFPLLKLYTSMRITDSIRDDISYFKAELNRISSIMAAVRSSGNTCLVLLDEPLRGTNSGDKQQGTRAIIETLQSCNTIGIVATHDTGLCDIELNFPGKVSNYHFESKVETGGLSFDFRLKTGCSVSNNATLLMRQMGIIR